MSIQDKCILIISPESWGTNFVSKHHYAHYLAKTNKVFFLNSAKHWRIRNLFQIPVDLHQIETNLTVISYGNYFPKIDKLPLWIQNLLFKKTARRIQKLLGVGMFDMVWSFDPMRFWNFKGWNCALKIYHPVDEHKAEKTEPITAHLANYIFAPSVFILDRFKNEQSKCFKIQHGADVETFQLNENQQLQLPGSNSIKAGLVGNFSSNIDYETIAACATKNPQVDFIFVGPYQSNNLSPVEAEVQAIIANLQKKNNIFFIGEVPSSTLINYLKAFSINLILYKEKADKPVLNSHKIMGYFYCGNVILSNFIAEYADAEPDLITMCRYNSQIADQLVEIASHLADHNQPHQIELRRNYAIDNSYTRQIEKIGAIIGC